MITVNLKISKPKKIRRSNSFSGVSRFSTSLPSLRMSHEATAVVPAVPIGLQTSSPTEPNKRFPGLSFLPRFKESSPKDKTKRKTRDDTTPRLSK